MTPFIGPGIRVRGLSKDVDVAIIGAGHAGLNALEEVRKVTESFVLINGGTLGTTCARVGCMPSKVAIEVANAYQSRAHFPRLGIAGADALQIDTAAALEHVRDLRDTFVDLVLANTTDQMGAELIEGFARFIGPNVLEVNGQRIRAGAIIIATGARSFVPEAWRELGDGLLTVDGMFELAELRDSMAVVGLGAIGIEMGQALSRLGIRVTGFERSDRIAQLDDPIINQQAIEIFSREFPIHLGHPATITRVGDKLAVSAGKHSVLVDRVLAALGRVPNVHRLGLERLGIPLRRDGVPVFDPHTLQVGGLPIYIAGDATGGVANLQRAADEGRIAGYNAVHAAPISFQPKIPMSIVFSEPNIACVGAPWSVLQRDPDATAVAQVRFGPVGRAMIMAQNRGVLRVYADKATGRILGGAMIGARSEHLAHLLAWAVQQGLTAAEVLRMPFYHPVIEEALQEVLFELVEKVEQPLDDLFQFERLPPPQSEPWTGIALS